MGMESFSFLPGEFQVTSQAVINWEPSGVAVAVSAEVRRVRKMKNPMEGNIEHRTFDIERRRKRRNCACVLESFESRIMKLCRGATSEISQTRSVWITRRRNSS